MMEVVFGKSAYGTMKYMGIDPADLYVFSLGLSMGDLTEKIYPDLTELKTRLEHGEELRLWYSEKSPEEYCTFCWLMAQLKEIETAELYAVILPHFFLLPDQCTMTCSDWGSVEPELWKPFLQQRTPLPRTHAVGAAMHWWELEQENTPLRAVVNGSLVSVPEDFYDHFLQKELKKQTEPFMEATLIANVLGIYQLGIGDEILHQRIETLLEKGLLQIVSPAEKGCPTIRRILKKV